MPQISTLTILLFTNGSLSCQCLIFYLSDLHALLLLIELPSSPFSCGLPFFLHWRVAAGSYIFSLAFKKFHIGDGNMGDCGWVWRVIFLDSEVIALYINSSLGSVYNTHISVG